MEAFTDFFARLWGSSLPHKLAYAICVALVFEGLTWLATQRLRRAFADVLARDIYLDATERVHKRRIVLGLPLLLTRALLYVVAILIIIRYFGFNTGAEIVPVVITLLAGAVLVFRQPLRDAAAGYFIAYDDLYNLNDRVTLGDLTGSVTAFSIRATRLRTQDGREITVPNSAIGQVINHSRSLPPVGRQA